MFNLEQQITPIWDTDTVWGESITFVKDENGEARAPLLFSPIDILSVTDARGETEYEYGKDYIIEGREIVRTKNSRMFAFEKGELYPETEIKGKTYPIPNGNILVGEGSFFHDRQISVSYTCKKGEWLGVRPVFAELELYNTVKALKKGKDLSILVYGDSICVGAQSSGICNVPPYQSNYFNLLCDALEEKTGSKIMRENPSVGGKNSIWGADNAKELIANKYFDLLIIGFGMNDGMFTSNEVFKARIIKIIDIARETNPKAEIILVATSTPNPIMTHPDAHFWGDQDRFKDILLKIAEERADGGIAVANITDMQRFLHTRKRFIDTTANNVNHPNDFFYRLYAQFLYGMITK